VYSFIEVPHSSTFVISYLKHSAVIYQLHTLCTQLHLDVIAWCLEKSENLLQHVITLCPTNYRLDILLIIQYISVTLFGPSLPAQQEEISFAWKYIALVKVVTGVKIETYYANLIIHWLPVPLSSQLVLRTCFRQRQVTPHVSHLPLIL
jgi:hypothetical protein